MDEETLKKMFTASQRETETKGRIDFTPEETERFQKAFEDSEFRRMFAEYMVIN
jgi:hypothetical protein